jgi:uncharacterized repeat protein (TIGR03803 family)
MMNNCCFRILRVTTVEIALGVVLMLIAAHSAPAQTLSTIYSFTGAPDGSSPEGRLVQDSTGHFYGTTSLGGAAGYGTIFKLDAMGKETVLYSFAGGADCATPIAGLVVDAAGNIYGTTELGGGKGGSGCAGLGCGTVFKLSATGVETVLHRFTGGTDGAVPLGSVTLDATGNLYGSAYAGGKYGFGTVFKLDSNGKFSVLYSFKGGADGGLPDTTPILDATGTLYGTTFWGGASRLYGTVYKLAGETESVLYSFKGYGDAACPCEDRLILDSKGNLYGATWTGGAFGVGTIFKVNKSGKETVLHSFMGVNDGGNPLAGIIRDKAGNFYGTTTAYATYGFGTGFKMDPAGAVTVLYDFDPNGFQPYDSKSALVRDANGNLFGTSYSGGTGQNGTVFQLNP